ncbi:hypothetical protein LR48_Vigan02g088600 [Vigna angularis]|uniref:Uncharacterized protein n=1 Tax=Phaseolus angularis TaxID=3914 RepID=A0A0L9TW77_PHAAN|nr:hypothetical protein LR48_Vigan02g088600 [Vigna angularis]
MPLATSALSSPKRNPNPNPSRHYRSAVNVRRCRNLHDHCQGPSRRSVTGQPLLCRRRHHAATSVHLLPSRNQPCHHHLQPCRQPSSHRNHPHRRVPQPQDRPRAPLLHGRRDTAPFSRPSSTATTILFASMPHRDSAMDAINEHHSRSPPFVSTPRRSTIAPPSPPSTLRREFFPLPHRKAATIFIFTTMNFFSIDHDASPARRNQI